MVDRQLTTAQMVDMLRRRAPDPEFEAQVLRIKAEMAKDDCSAEESKALEEELEKAIDVSAWLRAHPHQLSDAQLMRLYLGHVLPLPEPTREELAAWVRSLTPDERFEVRVRLIRIGMAKDDCSAEDRRRLQRKLDALVDVPEESRSNPSQLTDDEWRRMYVAFVLAEGKDR